MSVVLTSPIQTEKQSAFATAATVDENDLGPPSVDEEDYTPPSEPEHDSEDDDFVEAADEEEIAVLDALIEAPREGDQSESEPGTTDEEDVSISNVMTRSKTMSRSESKPKSKSKKKSKTKSKSKSKSKRKAAQRLRQAEKDKLGNRIWRCLVFTYDATLPLNNLQIKLQFAGIFEARLRHSVVERVRRAVKLAGSWDNRNSEFCLQMMRLHASLDVDSHIKWILDHMMLDTKARAGMPIVTGKEYLDMPSYVKQSDLKKRICYLFIVTDAQGNIVLVYCGSGTSSAPEGGMLRLIQYDDFKAASDLGRVNDTNQRSAYLSQALKKENTIHIRPLFAVDREHSTPARVVGVEGHMTDVFNTLDVVSESRGTHRTDASLAAYTKAVPRDMLNVPYGKGNRAHQLIQGARGSAPPCSGLGKGCNHDPLERAYLVYKLDNELVYGCHDFYNKFWYFKKDKIYTNLEEIVPAFLEDWTYKKATSKRVHHDLDHTCDACGRPKGADQGNGFCRGFLGNTSRMLCSRCKLHFVGATAVPRIAWREKKIKDDAHAEIVWNAFFKTVQAAIEEEAEIRERSNNAKHGTCCVCHGKPYQTTAEIRPVSGTFYPKEVSSSLHMCLTCRKWWYQLVYRRPAKVPKTFAAYILFYEQHLAERPKQSSTKGSLCLCSTDGDDVEGVSCPKTFPVTWKSEFPRLCTSCRSHWHRSKTLTRRKDKKFKAEHPFLTLIEFQDYCQEKRRLFRETDSGKSLPSAPVVVAPPIVVTPPVRVDAEGRPKRVIRPVQRLLLYDDPLDRPLGKPVFK